jgi:coatomer subunit beta'
MFLLGYIPRDNRAFVCDKHLTIISYSVPLVVIEYQSAILRGDLSHASTLLPSVPAEHRNRIARFLETQGFLFLTAGHKEEALNVTTDLEHRFELSMGLMQLNVAYDIANELNHEHKWKLLGDTSLQAWNYRLAIESYKKAGDLENLFLIYQASGNAIGLSEVASLAGIFS